MFTCILSPKRTLSVEKFGGNTTNIVWDKRGQDDMFLGLPWGSTYKSGSNLFEGKNLLLIFASSSLSFSW